MNSTTKFVYNEEERKCLFYCPGCGQAHWVDERWSVDPVKMTIDPSVVTRIGNQVVCHLFVREGKLLYLPDSKHSLAGMEVNMEDL